MKNALIGFFVFLLSYCKNSQHLTNNVQDCDTALKNELNIGWKRLENTARNPGASFYKNDSGSRFVII